MRRRILLLVVGVTVLVVLAFAIPVTILVRTAVNQNAEKAARQQAGYIAAYLSSGTLSKPEIKTFITQQTDSTGRPVSVRCPDGTLLGSTPADSEQQPGERRSPSGSFPAPEPSTGPEGDGGPGSGPGPGAPQLNAAPAGQVATAFAPTSRGAYVVHVYLSNSARNEGLTKWYLLIGLGSLGLLLIGIGAGEVMTRRITRPLVRTAETAQQLSMGDVTARAPTDGPREIADVGKALNRLADRIDQLIAEERETVADLSHRLRTPLTTLRLDAEALRDQAEAERVGAHVSDLERMLTAVIHAARRPQREGRLPSCDATDVVGERVEFWSALTDEQGRHSEIALPDKALPVRSSAGDLAAAVDALLENVVAHTEEGTAFTVRLTATEHGARLEIGDDGPGIPEAAEVRGRSDRGSTGLGLDIARRCAEASGGSMHIGRTPAGGALVVLDLLAP